MTVELLTNTSLAIADEAISKCWAKPSKSVSHLIDRMYKVGIKNKHSSTLEHINYTFDIDGISRACLQELVRHRHASITVKSTRYTLKELKDTLDVSQYLVPVTSAINYHNEEQLRKIQAELQAGISNDLVKYMLPEAYKTSLIWTINMRSLRNFVELRTSKAALPEIRELAYSIMDHIPVEHKFMYEDVIK